MKIKRFALILSLMISCAVVQAGPAFMVQQTVLQPDGTLLIIVKLGDENFHFYTTTDGVPVTAGNKGGYYYAILNGGAIEADGLLAHEEKTRTVVEQQHAMKLKNDFYARLSAKRAQQRYGVGSISLASVNPIGEQKIPVILVQFADVKFTTVSDSTDFTDDAAFFNRHLNGENYKDEGAGSVRDYFINQSDSLFRPSFDVIGPVTLGNVRAYYGGSDDKNVDIRPVEMIQDAIDKAMEAGTDFSQYATTSSGVPLVGIIFAGFGDQSSNDDDALWARYIGNVYYEKKPYTFRAAFYTNELAKYSSQKPITRDGIGPFCHEFSHAMGLPDFYNTNGKEGYFGLDRWDIMDFGFYLDGAKTPVGYSAYERNFMGWLKADTLYKKKQAVKIAPLASGKKNRSYMILNDANPNEYYILENRQHSPWYPSKFGYGMMVYRVDYDTDVWTSNAVNNDSLHQRITILPADNVLKSRFADDLTNEDYSGDFFPGLKGVTELTNYTTPCDTAYTGGYMNCSLKQIQVDDEMNVTFIYMADGQLAKPQNFILEKTTDESCSFSWAASEQAESYVLTLKENNAIVKTDTVRTNTHTFSKLSGNSDYEVSLTAIAADYVDSEPESIAVSTYPTLVHSVTGGYGDADIYTAGGVYVGKRSDMKNKNLTVPGFLLKNGKKGKMVIVK